MRHTKCPICSKSVKKEYAPFCSKRCADIDLGRWLDERYRFPAREGDIGDDEAPENDET